MKPRTPKSRSSGNESLIRRYIVSERSLPSFLLTINGSRGYSSVDYQQEIECIGYVRLSYDFGTDFGGHASNRILRNNWMLIEN
jgi:hypothetical protein